MSAKKKKFPQPVAEVVSASIQTVTAFLEAALLIFRATTISTISTISTKFRLYHSLTHHQLFFPSLQSTEMGENKVVKRLKSFYQSVWKRKLSAPLRKELLNVISDLAAPETLPASSLTVSQVVKIFDLKEDNRPKIWKLEKLMHIPSAVQERMDEIMKVLDLEDPNESKSRMRIDDLLIKYVATEILRFEQKTGISQNSRPVTLTTETTPQLNVEHDGETRMLNDRSDYSIWYDDHTMGRNLVVIEAKRQFAYQGALPQCLAHMGMVFLALEEVEEIFTLQQDERPKIWKLDKLMDVPVSVQERMDEIRNVLDSKGSNETKSRMRIDNLLIKSVANEILRFDQVTKAGMSQNSRPISLTTETTLQLKVQHNGESRMLNGRSDYSIWYDDHTMGTNLVVIEAKRRCAYSSAIPQCLAYMAMVHQIRKDEGRENSIVFGCCSDAYKFVFLRIDNNGQWSESPVLDWESGRRSQKKIWMNLCRIMESATSLSPRCSLQKNVTRVTDTSGHGQPYYQFHHGSVASDEELPDASSSDTSLG